MSNQQKMSIIISFTSNLYMSTSTSVFFLSHVVDDLTKIPREINDVVAGNYSFFQWMWGFSVNRGNMHPCYFHGSLIQNRHWLYRELFLGLTYFFGKFWYTYISIHSYIQGFHAFNIIGLVKNSTLKFKIDTKKKS